MASARQTGVDRLIGVLQKLAKARRGQTCYYMLVQARRPCKSYSTSLRQECNKRFYIRKPSVAVIYPFTCPLPPSLRQDLDPPLK